MGTAWNRRPIILNTIMETTETFTVDARIVWAAAVAAFRINDRQYFKYAKTFILDTDGSQKVLYDTNRSVFNRLITQPELLLESDYTDGDHYRHYLQQQTFKLLSGEWISSFVRDAIPLADVTEFHPLQQRKEVGMIVALPNIIVHAIKRDENNNLLKFATGFIGKMDERITLTIRVAKCIYSEKYNVFFVSGLTEDNKAVFFPYKERIFGNELTIAGTVKGYKDNMTKLNRVSLKEG